MGSHESTTQPKVSRNESLKHCTKKPFPRNVINVETIRNRMRQSFPEIRKFFKNSCTILKTKTCCKGIDKHTQTKIQEEIEDEQQKLDRLRNETDEAEKKLKELKKEIEKIQQKLNKLKRTYAVETILDQPTQQTGVKGKTVQSLQKPREDEDNKLKEPQKECKSTLKKTPDAVKENQKQPKQQTGEKGKTVQGPQKPTEGVVEHLKEPQKEYKLCIIQPIQYRQTLCEIINQLIAEIDKVTTTRYSLNVSRCKCPPNDHAMNACRIVLCHLPTRVMADVTEAIESLDNIAGGSTILLTVNRVIEENSEMLTPSRSSVDISKFRKDIKCILDLAIDVNYPQMHACEINTNTISTIADLLYKMQEEETTLDIASRGY